MVSLLVVFYQWLFQIGSRQPEIGKMNSFDAVFLKLKKDKKEIIFMRITYEREWVDLY